MKYSLNKDQVKILSDIACDNIELVLDELGVDYRKGGKFFSGRCPVHQGDNDSAWNIYPDGYDIRGFWKCRTHLCHQKYGSNLVALVQAIKQCSQLEAAKWLTSLLNIKLSDLKIDPEQKDKLGFVKDVQRLKKVKLEGTLSRADIRKSLKIPAEFYLNRGYQKSTLDKYDVGLCETSNKPFYNRIVVPIYSSEFNYLGATARTIFPSCSKCKYYHTGECPKTPLEIYKSHKWINSKNLRADSILYNLNYAKDDILKTGVVILVEGPGDIWRLEEAGIHNGIAILGNEMSPIQSSMLQSTGALKLIPLLDEDKAGREGKSLIRKNLGRIYDIVEVTIPKKDVGDISIEEIREILCPVIDRIRI